MLFSKFSLFLGPHSFTCNPPSMSVKYWHIKLFLQYHFVLVIYASHNVHTTTFYTYISCRYRGLVHRGTHLYVHNFAKSLGFLFVQHVIEKTTTKCLNFWFSSLKGFKILTECVLLYSCHLIHQYCPLWRENNHGRRMYDDLQNWVDMT